MIQKNKIWFVLMIATLSVLTYFLFRNSFGMTNYQQFSYLSKSFLEGSLSFTENYDGWWHDAVLFNGNYYWPLGPLPGILLMPFQFVANYFDAIFFQGYLQSFLVVGVFAVIYKIGRKLEFSSLDSAYLAVGFTGATTFLGIAMWPNAWFLAQVVTTLLIFLGFWEYLNKKRYWVIGILFGLIFSTRLTAALGILFFVLEILTTKSNVKFRKLFHLGIGVVPFVILGLVYNYARFGSLLEQGYSYQNVAGAFGYVKEYGLFSHLYIFPNLYYMFINGPIPVFIENTKILTSPFLKADPWGMGLLFTSPILIFTFLAGKWLTHKNIKLLLITSFVIAIPILFYYGIGWYQFGFRYSLDFLPFIFLAILYNSKENNKSLSAPLKILILLSSLLNMYLFGTIFIL